MASFALPTAERTRPSASSARPLASRRRLPVALPAALLTVPVTFLVAPMTRPLSMTKLLNKRWPSEQSACGEGSGVRHDACTVCDDDLPHHEVAGRSGRRWCRECERLGRV